MIKINLLGDDTARDNSSVFIVAAYVASIVLCIGVFAWMQNSVNGKVTSLSTEVAKLEGQLARLQEVTKEVKDLDKTRAELNDKLVVIATLKRSKVGPVRVLDDLNLALPERAWVTDLRETDGSLRINGFALDSQTIATFMKDLGNSDYFRSVELVETKTVDKLGAKIRDFQLEAKISYAGKIRPKKPEDAAAPQQPAASEAPAQPAQTS